MKTGFFLLSTHFLISQLVNAASVKAPLDIITLDDLTPSEREHLDYLNKISESREKRSSHGLLSALGSGIKLIGQGSASAVAHGSSSSSGYYDHPPEPEHHDGKSFDFWTLKKSVLNTLLQAAKAIKGAAIAVTGKLIKGSGYLVSGSGKLISAKGEAVSNLGKKIASSAKLSPPSHSHFSSSGYSDHPHEEYHSLYGPSGHSDADVAPSAPAIEYEHPSYKPTKYSSFGDAIKHETLHGLPSGILILKKIPRHLQDAQESKNVPIFKPLKSPEPSKAESSPILSGLLTNIFSSSSHAQPQTAETEHTDEYLDDEPPIKTSPDTKPDEDSIIKPVNEQSPSVNGDKPSLIDNNTYNLDGLPNYDSFPGGLVDIPDFAMHPGFYINNLAASENSPPSLNSLNDFSTQFPTEYLNPPNLNDNIFLQDPRSAKPLSFSPTILAPKGPKFPLTPPTNFIRTNPVKIPPKLETIRFKYPQRHQLVKSISYQLGPNGPVKI